MTTRREIVKAGAGLAAIIAAGRAPAALIRSALAARNGLMAGKRLPYDAEVEYLESTGTQYIDIPVSVSARQFLELSGAISAVNFARNAVLWDADAVDQFRSYSYSESASSIVFASFVGRVAQYGGWVVTPNRMTTFALSTTGKTVDGVFTALPRPLTSALSKIRIFGTIQSGYLFASVRFAAVKITVGNDVVFNGIPVRKGTVGYMYDRVSGQLFGNDGTGDFVLGPDVVPVEYLEAFDGPYIDTAVLSATDVSMEVEAAFEWDQLSTESSYGSYFGCNAAGSAGAVVVGFTADKTSLRAYFGSSSGTQDVRMPINSSFNTFFCSKDVCRINQQSSTTTGTPSISTQLWIFLFRNNADWSGGSSRPKCKIKYVKFYKGSTPVRSFRPVRVGTDVTSWEGAMMDVLTRRIYRNAGSGAFTYGNDLKYPIPAE